MKTIIITALILGVASVAFFVGRANVKIGHVKPKQEYLVPVGTYEEIMDNKAYRWLHFQVPEDAVCVEEMKILLKEHANYVTFEQGSSTYRRAE